MHFAENVPSLIWKSVYPVEAHMRLINEGMYEPGALLMNDG